MKQKKVKVIYNCRDIVMLQKDGLYVVCTHFQGVDDQTGRVLGDACELFSNPLEAFDYWNKKVYSAGRARIGEFLKEHGRNPLTGEIDMQIIREKSERSLWESAEGIEKDR